MKKFAKVLAIMMVAVMSLALMVSCAPNSDPDKAKKALDENGYVALKVPGLGNVLFTVSGTKTVKDKDGKNKLETVTIMYYNTADAAKEAFGEEKEKNDKEDSDWVVKQSGKMIYFGTKQAIKDAR